MAQSSESREMREHENLIEELYEQYQPLMELSSDPMYLYLDDVHKVCNEKLASMWGFTQDQWNRTSPFLDNLVAEESRFKMSSNYRDARTDFKPATFGFTGRRKDGSTFDAEAAMAPISYKNEFFTLNLIRELKK